MPEIKITLKAIGEVVRNVLTANVVPRLDNVENRLDKLEMSAEENTKLLHGLNGKADLLVGDHQNIIEIGRDVERLKVKVEALEH